MEKILWFQNGKFKIEGTVLHIEVELDGDKVQAPASGLLSSVEANLHDARPPVRVNVRVQPLELARGMGRR